MDNTYGKKLMSFLCAAAVAVCAAVVPVSDSGTALIDLSVKSEAAETNTYEGFTYQKMAGYVQLLSYSGSSANVRIPNYIEGTKVTYVYASTFQNNTDIEEITVPSNVLTIQEGAFTGCTNLKRINCSNNDNYEFSGKMLYHLQEDGFSSSKINHESVTYKKNLVYCCSDSSYITIPDGVDAIGKSAFEGRTKLEHIVLPAGMQYIGERAFALCTDLSTMSSTQTENGSSEFVIPYGTKMLGRQAFAGCSEIHSVSFPSTLLAIDDMCFYNATNLRSVYIPPSVIYIGFNAFAALDSIVDGSDGIVYGEDGKIESRSAANARYGSYSSYTTAANAGSSGISFAKIHDPDIPESHDYLVSAGTQPTCTAPGAFCGICWCGYTHYFEAPALGHAFALTGSTGSGECEYTCARCGDTKTVQPLLKCGVSAMRPSDEYADTSRMTMKLYDDEGGAVREVQTDGSGNFALDAADEGTYSAVISMPGFAPRTEQVTIGSGSTDLDLKLCKYGDTNGEGEVDLRDMALMQQKLANWDVDYVYDETADVNCDGTHDLRDLALMQQKLAKWDVTFG